MRASKIALFILSRSTPIQTRVVVEEHVDHGVEVLRVGRKRRVELLVDAHHVLQRRLLQPLAEGLLDELHHERVVLGPDAAARPHGASEKLGRVAAAGAELRHAVAGLDAEEREELARVPPGVELPVLGVAILRVDERLDRRRNGDVRGGRRASARSPSAPGAEVAPRRRRPWRSARSPACSGGTGEIEHGRYRRGGGATAGKGEEGEGVDEPGHGAHGTASIYAGRAPGEHRHDGRSGDG